VLQGAGAHLERRKRSEWEGVEGEQPLAQMHQALRYWTCHTSPRQGRQPGAHRTVSGPLRRKQDTAPLLLGAKEAHRSASNSCQAAPWQGEAGVCVSWGLGAYTEEEGLVLVVVRGEVAQHPSDARVVRPGPNHSQRHHRPLHRTPPKNVTPGQRCTTVVGRRNTLCPWALTHSPWPVAHSSWAVIAHGAKIAIIAPWATVGLPLA